MTKDILEVKRGDIVEFKKYALRVEETILGNGSITLIGRISIDGCPIVRKRFLGNHPVTIRETR